MQILNIGETSSMPRENLYASDGNPTNYMRYSKKKRFSVIMLMMKDFSYVENAGRMQESIDKYSSVSNDFIYDTIFVMMFLKASSVFKGS